MFLFPLKNGFSLKHVLKEPVFKDHFFCFPWTVAIDRFDCICIWIRKGWPLFKHRHQHTFTFNHGKAKVYSASIVELEEQSLCFSSGVNGEGSLQPPAPFPYTCILSLLQMMPGEVWWSYSHTCRGNDNLITFWLVWSSRARRKDVSHGLTQGSDLWSDLSMKDSWTFFLIKGRLGKGSGNLVVRVIWKRKSVYWVILNHCLYICRQCGSWYIRPERLSRQETCQIWGKLLKTQRKLINRSGWWVKL